jgi:hypothetical protein
MPALPLKAISRLIAEEFERRGIGVEGGEGEGSADQPTEQQLREQFESYQQARKGKFGLPEFFNFDSFKRASQEKRAEVLAKYNVPTTWRPTAPGGVKAGR